VDCFAQVPAASLGGIGMDGRSSGPSVIDQERTDARPKTIREAGKGLGVPHM
jgi:hypothetical protein